MKTSISPDAIEDTSGDPYMEAAERAGLRHTSLDRPGMSRERIGGSGSGTGSGWRYKRPDGTIVEDERTLSRIRKIVIPPAWRDVWINPDPRGHIQATGLDDCGRKQYRYHPKWSAYRSETKFAHLAAFGEALPAIRDRVESDLARHGFPREKVLATIVKLLDTSLIRIGSREYERANGSFGLTTLRNRHVSVTGGTIHFTFKGKGGVEHTVELHDRKLAAIVKRMRELPGYHVFQYVDGDHRRHDVSSEDVNGYLREISGEQFTAKDFRTWAGTVRFVADVRDEPAPPASEANHRVVAAIKCVSQALGNTPAVCRASYIHPAVIDAYLDGSTLRQSWRRAQRRQEAHHERAIEELVVLDLLR